MKARCLFLIVCFLPLLLHAELSPSAYEGMQAKAPEFLRVEILRVDVAPGDTPSDQNIQLVATVSEVTRTATGLKPNDIINISYTVTDHPKGWAGPGKIPILAEKDQTVAYLIKGEAGDYTPAAGRMSFSNF